MATVTKLSKLEFAIGLRDGATSKLGKLMRSVDQTTRQVPKQFKKAGLSIMGVWGSMRGMGGMFNPAREIEQSLNKLRAMNVDAPALAQLEKSSKVAALRFGLNAGEIIASASEVRASFNALNGADLARVTTASNVFAKAAQTDAASASRYLGSMQGMFEKQAAAMGDARWVEALTGKTALALQQYEKASVSGFEAAFSSLGEVARKNRISLEEQITVLGIAQQAGFEGGKAGEVYKSLFANRHKAEAVLGVKLTGAGGELLPMQELLAQLEKSGASDAHLENIFGADALKLIKAASGDIGKLQVNIKALQGVTAANPAEEMALKMTDAFDKASASARVAGAAFSQKLMPGVEKALGVFSGFMAKLTRWMDLAPNLTSWIGYIVMAALGFAAVMGALSATLAVGKIALGGFTLATKALVPVIKLARVAKLLWIASMGVAKAALVTLRLGVALTAGGIFRLGKSFLSMIPRVLAFSASLLACPLTWIVLGIVALIAAIGSLIYWWDDLKAAFLDSAFGQGVLGVIDSIIGGFDLLVEAGAWAVGAVGKLFSNLFDWIMAPFKALANGVIWLGKKLGILDEDFGLLPEMPEMQALPLPESLGAAQTLRAPEGGIKRELASMQTNNRSSDNSTHIGEQHIHVEQRLSSDDLQNAWALGV